MAQPVLLTRWSTSANKVKGEIAVHMEALHVGQDGAPQSIVTSVILPADAAIDLARDILAAALQAGAQPSPD